MDFFVDGRRIEVYTTDFSKIDMEKLFLQITEWKEEVCKRNIDEIFIESPCFAT